MYMSAGPVLSLLIRATEGLLWSVAKLFRNNDILLLVCRAGGQRLLSVSQRGLLRNGQGRSFTEGVQVTNQDLIKAIIIMFRAECHICVSRDESLMFATSSFFKSGFLSFHRVIPFTIFSVGRPLVSFRFIFPHRSESYAYFNAV